MRMRQIAGGLMPEKVSSAGNIQSYIGCNCRSTSSTRALALVGLDFRLAGLNWAVPIGISFFTFQALGYLWDVYYKRQEAERDFLTCALFVSFFPSILFGPINKASLVLPQLRQLRRFRLFALCRQG